MRDSRPQLLNTLLNEHAISGSSLKKIQHQAATLIKLHRVVMTLLPTPLNSWCRVANFRQGILVLETANASWMMRLRYEQSNLLFALRTQILPSLSAIDIRINPSLTMGKEHNIPTTPMPLVAIQHTKQLEHQLVPIRTLSKESATQLQLLADRSPSKLREKLERLAALAEESTNATCRIQNTSKYKKK